MIIFSREQEDGPELPKSSQFLNNILSILNKIMYEILSLGHIILFALFLYMGLYLFHKSKKVIFNAKMQGINEAYLKKKGRNVSCILVIISFGFLTGFLTNTILIMYGRTSDSILLNALDVDHRSIHTENVFMVFKGLTPLMRFLILLVCLGSFIGFISLIIGLYLWSYGKTVLRTKLRPSGFILIGIGLLFVCGLNPGLSLLFKI